MEGWGGQSWDWCGGSMDLNRTCGMHHLSLFVNQSISSHSHSRICSSDFHTLDTFSLGGYAGYSYTQEAGENYPIFQARLACDCKS